ncbi:ACP S-malonyltransferase [Cohnella suwonensis]|uniref:[acyl-carrier-protein] S-malonyltransferase n=1 Tax=Cohnella suwonensis TaxID=696072 RepID=A0ABW0M0J2_9BACL
MTRVGLLFPGQGSQYAGMGKSLAERYPVARETFEEASDALGWNVLRLCADGDLAELTETENAQPAILTHSVAAFRVLTEEGAIRPAIGAGHSLGEFSALACSGAIAFADAVKLVRKRGEFMQAAARSGSGGMAAVGGISGERLEKLLLQASEADSIVVLAGINSPDQRTVSGHRDALGRLEKLLSDTDADASADSPVRFTPLNVSAAFHSPCMEEASERLREQLEACVFQAPRWPVLSNVTGRPHDGDPGSLIRLLTAQMTEPVRWLSCMETMLAFGADQTVETGPGRVLTRLWKSFAPNADAWPADDSTELANRLGRRLGLSEPTRGSAAAFLPRCLGIAAATRNRNADPDAYRRGVLEPYREVEKLARTGSVPTEDELRLGWDMLQSVFDTKGTEPEERLFRLSGLIEETGTSHLFTFNKGGVAK